MIRLLRLFIVLVAIVAAAAWLADHPGQLQLDWQGYRIESSIALLLLAGIALYALLRLPFWIYNRLRGTHGQLARQNNGITALTQGMTAIAAGDPDDARRFAARAERLLNGAPLALLMQAQAAQLRRDEGAARGYFQSMLAAPGTEFLGVRGLLAQAMRQGDMAYAGRLVDRAMSLQPKSPWLIRNKFEIECATGAWSQARETLGRAVQNKLITKAERTRRQAVLAYAEAAETFGKGDETQALVAAQTALKGAPDLIPAAILAARILAQSGKPDKAGKLIEKTWARSPHPDLATAYAALVPNETPAQRNVRTRRLISANPDHLESRLLGAETALAASETAHARELLKPLIGTEDSPDASPRASMLMAQLAQAQGLGPQEAQRWLARAPLATPDPAWQCQACGKQAPAWRISCLACGEFDSIQWRATGKTPSGEISQDAGLLAHLTPL
ncbi:MAG: heme biosynthesis HemY N-terminal domain-containing protein [Alphaproteobacteria bacterium]|nr:heme biosynthesis HemY N-terminal domain-containing protein [Alphaproteobacteria bacterium]